MATRSSIALRKAQAMERIERATGAIAEQLDLGALAHARSRYPEMQRVLEAEHQADVLEQIREALESKGTEAPAPAPAPQEVVPAEVSQAVPAAPKPTKPSKRKNGKPKR
jgi:hypothetical protein